MQKNIIHHFFYIIFIIACGCFTDRDSGAEAAGNGTAGGTPSTVYFRDDFNGTEVDSSVWQIATWSEHGGQTGTERCYIDDGKLTLVFRNESGTYLSSAIQTRKEYLYGKWEARLKPSNVAGILNSMYTIDWDDMSTATSSSDGTKQEIDIEFLTKSFSGTDGQVHFAVHASGKTSFNLNPDLALGFDPSADFHVWAIEITAERINWYVDGTLLHTYLYSSGININGPYQLKLNAWTAVDWIGGPPAANVDCIYQIDWIQFTPSAE